MVDVFVKDPDRWGEGRTHRVDKAIGAMAARQHGVIARHQLKGLGLSDGAVENRVAGGRLHLLRRGVYAVGHPIISQEGQWLAGVLSVGETAVLSHRSAAALWELLPDAGLIHITAPGGDQRQRGLRLHRSRCLQLKKRTRRHGIPVTTPAQTVFDLATSGEPVRLVRRAYEAAERQGILRLDHLAEMRIAGRGHRGLGIIDELLAETAPPPRLRSGLELDFLDFCREHGLPLPRCNVVVARIEVDTLWEDAKLIAELDSWGFHRSRRSFERDRERDARLLLVGYRVIRITRERLEGRPRIVAGELRKLLEA